MVVEEYETTKKEIDELEHNIKLHSEQLKMLKLSFFNKVFKKSQIVSLEIDINEEIIILNMMFQKLNSLEEAISILYKKYTVQFQDLDVLLNDLLDRKYSLGELIKNEIKEIKGLLQININELPNTIYFDEKEELKNAIKEALMLKNINIENKEKTIDDNVKDKQKVLYSK